MAIVNIQPLADSVTCKGGESVECVFDIINASDGAVRVAVKPVGELADKGWVELTGPDELSLPERGQDKVKVTVEVPADATPTGEAPARFSFKLLCYDVRETENAVESPAVAVEVPAVAPEPDPEPEQKDDDGLPWGLIIGIAGGVVGVVAIGILIFVLVSGGKKVEIPDIVGVTVDEAQQTLEGAGLAMALPPSEEVTGENEPGTVTNQNPAAGDKVEKGTEVSVTMELLSVEVPLLLGLNVAAAERRLINAELGLGKTSYQVTGDSPGGTVISQTPEGNTRLIPGTLVDVVVEKELVAVPDLKGRAYSDAIALLERDGLVRGRVTEGNKGGTPGTVITHRPGAGQQVDRGTAVQLLIEEQRIRVPDVRGDTLDVATRKLIGAGLKVADIKTDRTQRTSKPNTIKSQVPRENTEASPGSDVRLVVHGNPFTVVTGNFSAIKLPSKTLFKMVREQGVVRAAPPPEEEDDNDN